VKVIELRAIADRIFAYLEETGRDEFEVSDDYYWAISKEEVYDPSKDPKDLTRKKRSIFRQESRCISIGWENLIGPFFSFRREA